MVKNIDFHLLFIGFKTAWQGIQIEQDLYDVTLGCEDKQIKAHKLIISSCSLVLKNIIKLNPNPHPLIYLRGVKYQDLRNILTFMYQGEVTVSEEDLKGFLEVAEDLNVRGLSQRNMGGCDSNEYIQEYDNLSNNDMIDDKKIVVTTSENMRTINQKYVDDKKETKKKCIEDNKGSNICTSFTCETGKKSYACGKCEKQFSSPNALILHQKSIHDGDQYLCHQCDYTANLKSSLRQHVQSIHEGKRYPCDICDYKATRKNYLRIHKLKFHN